MTPWNFPILNIFKTLLEFPLSSTEGYGKFLEKPIAVMFGGKITATGREVGTAKASTNFFLENND